MNDREPHGAHAETRGARTNDGGPHSHGTEERPGPAGLPGLASSEGALRLEAEPMIVAAGAEVPFEVRIVRDPDGPVTSFDVLHDRRMHLIVVRRDLTGFQHLHPEMDDSGSWRTNLTLPSGGAWRAFADFSTDGTPTTLGIDVFADGHFKAESIPEASTSARVGDHVVSLEHGDAADLVRFTVTRDGEPVRIEPYLGAMGHLVALRWGDLAFLHIHPVGEDIAFAVTYPAAGVYRLFLQYLVEGQVRTASFTVRSGG